MVCGQPSGKNLGSQPLLEIIETIHVTKLLKLEAHINLSFHKFGLSCDMWSVTWDVNNH